VATDAHQQGWPTVCEDISVKILRERSTPRSFTTFSKYREDLYV
jgi:hypothetical protein